MHLLLSNDDGIHAPGLAVLNRAAQRVGDVTVAAPLSQQSAVGHAIRPPLFYDFPGGDIACCTDPWRHLYLCQQGIINAHHGSHTGTPAQRK